MKTKLLIPLLSLALSAAMGQNRYWRYEATFTLANGATSSTIGTTQTYKGQPINYDDIKRQTANWIKPCKLKSISITSLKQIKKSEMIKKADRFICPEPPKSLFSFYSGTASDFTGISTIQSSSIRWHWGDNKIPMTWLPKPNTTNIDSVEIYVKKGLTYWLNDSTLIIKKPK